MYCIYIFKVGKSKQFAFSMAMEMFSIRLHMGTAKMKEDK